MPTHVADIPRPKYAYVKDQFLYDMTDGYGDLTECLIYGLSSIPGRAWGLSVMLKNGALVQHLPVHAFTSSGLWCGSHGLKDLQVWGCYGNDFSTHEYSALSEMPVKVYMKRSDSYSNGTYWFTAAPYGDMYSLTPDQHKHFNFIWLDCGCLASMPGNRMMMYDSSFVELPEERPNYLVNTQYWYPEEMDNEPFDKVITSKTG